ncbi:MAG: PaaI family thioesterase [Pseudomonadota bacterium]
MLEPRESNFESKVRASFAKQGIMATIGGSIVSIEPGKVELSMPFSSAISQQHGFVHAGIITTMLDSACGYAAYSLMAPDAEVLTIEIKTNLLAPAKGEQFRFMGRVIKAGRTITFCDGEAFAISNGNEKRIVTMSATMMAITGRQDVRG